MRCRTQSFFLVFYHAWMNDDGQWVVRVVCNAQTIHLNGQALLLYFILCISHLVR